MWSTFVADSIYVLFNLCFLTSFFHLCCIPFKTLIILISSTSKSISLSVCNCPHHNSIRHHLGVNWGRHCMYARLLLCFHYFPAEFHEQSQRRWKLFFFFWWKFSYLLFREDSQRRYLAFGSDRACYGPWKS